MKSIIQHLRFPFSILLMPVFWLSTFFIPASMWDWKIYLLFVILHVLVYPSSNAYNSTQDNDKESVGLIKEPLPISKNLFFVTICFDAIAITLAFFIGWITALLIVLYIIGSRLYSWRKVRIKQYPYLGFVSVFCCQGALIFYIIASVYKTDFGFLVCIIQYAIPALLASFMIGAVYPLSQIYQHQQDLDDGVVTISYKLGKRGTFIFSAIQFVIVSTGLSYLFFEESNYKALFIYFALQGPVIAYFAYWAIKVFNDESQANFKHTMIMNLIAACCMNICFIALNFFL
jgi:1,4-dihydroxy-2-naphthoate polyprenyltransferase